MFCSTFFFLIQRPLSHNLLMKAIHHGMFAGPYQANYAFMDEEQETGDSWSADYRI